MRVLDFGGDKTPPFLVTGTGGRRSGRGASGCCSMRPTALPRNCAAIVETAPRLPAARDGADGRPRGRRCALVRDALRAAAGLAPAPPLGAMIEMPAAALCADELVDESDFFSIGTNDLVQYTLAADRENPRLADLAVAHHPPCCA